MLAHWNVMKRGSEGWPSKLLKHTWTKKCAQCRKVQIMFTKLSHKMQDFILTHSANYIQQNRLRMDIEQETIFHSLLYAWAFWFPKQAIMQPTCFPPCTCRCSYSIWWHAKISTNLWGSGGFGELSSSLHQCAGPRPSPRNLKMLTLSIAIPPRKIGAWSLSFP